MGSTGRSTGISGPKIARSWRRIWNGSSRSDEGFMGREIGDLLFKMLRLAKEPPFRLFVRQAVRLLNTSVHTKADWGAVEHPHFLVGIVGGTNAVFPDSIPVV